MSRRERRRLKKLVALRAALFLFNYWIENFPFAGVSAAKGNITSLCDLRASAVNIHSSCRPDPLRWQSAAFTASNTGASTIWNMRLNGSQATKSPVSTAWAYHTHP